MADYVLRPGGVVRASDGAFVPDDPGNRDWRDYQTWLAAGNTPDPEPAPPPSRVVSGAVFLSLFTPAEVAALWTADPRLMAGALKVAAQGTCNLGSDECAALMQLAVAHGALSAERVPQILAGEAPA